MEQAEAQMNTRLNQNQKTYGAWEVSAVPETTYVQVQDTRSHKVEKTCLTASDAMMMPAMADLKIASTAASLPHITPLLISDFTAQPLQSALPHC